MHWALWILIVVFGLTVGLPLLLIFLASSFLGLSITVGLLPIYIVGFILSGFAIFIGLMVAPSHPQFGKYTAYVGVGGLMLLLLIIETSILAAAGYRLGNKFLSDKLWTECTSTPTSIINFVSCAITGHQPLPTSYKDIWGLFGVYGFYIFGLIVPLFILSALFADFVEASGVVQNPTYQKIIGFGLGFMAYRGFVVTRLIYILDIGSAGVAVIALNFIWLGGILSYIRRSFRQWALVEAEQTLSRDLPLIIRSLKAIANSWNTQTGVAAAFSDEKFLRNLTLVVGPIKAKELINLSAKQVPVQQIKQEVIKAIDDAMK
ncbi:MAG: hypothetical protein N3E38_03035 [Candidatus Aenigmarchaeota archaeon]|nr:hypothetical protein [Candidatus Aenigmarchaeota archaeon]